MTDISTIRLKALFEISHRLHKINNLGKLLNEIIQTAIDTIGAERGLIILADEKGESYHTIAAHLSDKEITFSKSIVQATLESGKTSLSSDIKSDAKFKETDSVQELNIISYICVPLLIPEIKKPLGTLYVDQRTSAMTFTEEDVAFLEAFANLAAIAINNTNTMEQLVNENIRLHEEVEKRFEFQGVIGQSKAMQKVYHRMKQIINDDCTVLITGESGSGKEVIAKAIHYNGDRKTKPFLAVNCGALPETLLEAELFGSVRGAFTGAVDKPGLIQAAQGGTLFLDEIHHTSQALQIKLLRVLQDKEIRRVGSTKTHILDVRMICATNEDLLAAIKTGRFRQDFLYRINIVTINVPPLRERREDIPLLAAHFLQKYCVEKEKKLTGFDKKAMQALIEYDWTENNIRELENETERLVIFADSGKTIMIDDLSDKIRKPNAGNATKPNMTAIAAEQTQKLADIERQYIQSVLNQVNGNQSKAAKLLGIPRTTLRAKMKKLGLSD